VPEPAIADTGGGLYAGGSVHAQHIVGRDQTNIGTAAGVDPSELAVTSPTRQNGIRGIIVTAAAADRHSGYDLISRYFAPAGVPEDRHRQRAHRPGPYWSHRLGRDTLTGLQASDRTGLVHTAVHGDRGPPHRPRGHRPRRHPEPQRRIARTANRL
jgi:hypothetical protein